MIVKELDALNMQSSGSATRFFVDNCKRSPYKLYQDSDTLLNRILIRNDANRIVDIAKLSPAILHAQEYKVCRVYVFRDDKDASGRVEDIIRTKLKEATDAG